VRIFVLHQSRRDSINVLFKKGRFPLLFNKLIVYSLDYCIDTKAVNYKLLIELGLSLIHNVFIFMDANADFTDWQVA
jgi:hypothetical protein